MNSASILRADAAKAAYLNKEQLLLSETVSQMLELYRPNFQEKNIEVDVQFAKDAQSVTADRDKMLQAIRNLIENSWKYTPPQGRVSIVSQKTEDGIKLMFCNSGKGISVKNLPYIFERFFRADRSRSREAGGAGIGLAIVKELIEAHDGKVGAHSSNNETKIWFVLPD